MVRPDVAGRKVARAVRWLDDAESILSGTKRCSRATRRAGISRC